MSFVMSPSNMQTYRQCPRQFYGRNIARTIPWTPSKQRLRGTEIHTEMEKMLRKGWRDDNSFDSAVDISYTSAVVQSVRQMMADGYVLHLEHELTIRKDGAPVDWWNDRAFLRAKADVVLLHPDPTMPVLIGDIKTGRNYGDDFQCRVECLLAHIIYRRPVVTYEYWYLDQGETEEGLIDFRNGLAPVQDIFDTMAEMRQAIKDSYFPARENKFCRWCLWYKKEECGL